MAEHVYSSHPPTTVDELRSKILDFPKVSSKAMAIRAIRSVKNRAQRVMNIDVVASKFLPDLFVVNKFLIFKCSLSIFIVSQSFRVIGDLQ